MAVVAGTGRRHSSAARWVLVGAVVFAVLGMHTLLGPGPAPAHAGAHPAAAAGHTAPLDTMGSAAPDAAAHCPGSGCPGHDAPSPVGGAHTLAHLCVAILAGITTVLLMLVLLLATRPSTWAARSHRAKAGRAWWRAPPWTAPSLTQLSVLRV